MSYLFDTFLYYPLFNALILIYDYVSFSDLGVAIVILTVLIRIILFPIFYKSFEHQTIMQKLQPALRQIQHEHKENKEKQALKMMELYKENKVNPFSGFLLILVQLPILIALYSVFNSGLADEALSGLYSFVYNPGTLNHLSLGLIDLNKKNIVIVVIAALAQYYKTKLTLPKQDSSAVVSDKNDAAAAIAKNMVIIGPLMTVFLLGYLPSAIGVYWLTSSVFSLLQQWYINKKVYAKKQLIQLKRCSNLWVVLTRA
jgi:YidC/Oxa1 family membrane protein insertase